MINLFAILKSVRARKKYSNSRVEKSGFTLIELSIVLVIIGLIVGGILTGQSLIRAAEIRSISTQKEQFISAIYTFKNIYNAIPGDMIDAQSIWGAAADCSVAQTTQATCNGDGNGKIDYSAPSGSKGNELFLFWKHLYNAGLIPSSQSGEYTGIKDGVNSNATTTKNSPSGKISKSLWYSVYRGTRSGQTWIFDGSYGNILEFGLPVTNYEPGTPVITAQEAFALDNKYDDGKPGTGIIMIRNQPSVSICALKSDGVTAAAYSDFATAIYNVTSTGNKCSLIFPEVF